jgi:lipoate-protein ligase A
VTWTVERLTTTPSDFHARPAPEPVTRTAWVCDPTDIALVLGSTQPDGLVDRAACDRAGARVVRRHSGGGAVLVVPGDLVWVDLLIPSDDELWRADVGTAFHWVGEAWAAALRDVGVPAPVVHRGGLEPRPWSREVCFAGLGPGEVTVAGRKVVGIAQRRRRSSVRFQCAALLRWDPEAVIHLLRVPPEAGAAIAEAATPVPAPGPAPGSAPGSALLDALLHHLP